LNLRKGRFEKELSESFKKINVSIDFDKKLYRQDIKGSIAYAKALKKAGFLSDNEEKAIIKGLEVIKKEIEEGRFEFREEDEDIHMNIENRLQELCGDAALKLHTGRSRNEQIVLDERLYLMDVCSSLKQGLSALLNAIADKAENCIEVIVPGYTHLRQAQPVSLGHLFLAYGWAILRDLERLNDYKKRLSVMPLGSGALAGSALGIDREFLCRELGFDRVSENSMDAVSSRDFIYEFLFICSSIFINYSRIAEDLIIFSTEEFGFLEIPDELCTTSSLMPQKKNPDALELTRGKASVVMGNLFQLLTLLKALPLTYNRDLQEDKPPLFSTSDAVLNITSVMKELFSGLLIKKERIEKALEASKGFIFATDLAHYLVKKGIPFRKAHQIVSSLVKYAVENGKTFDELCTAEYKRFCSDFDDDVFSIFDYKRSVNSYDVKGGTALKRVKEELSAFRAGLKEFLSVSF